MSIHFPKQGKENFLIESMHRFGKAMEGKEGLIMAQTAKDEDRNCLVGLAIWDSKENWLEARPAMIEAVKDNSFEEWEEGSPQVFHLVDI